MTVWWPSDDNLVTVRWQLDNSKMTGLHLQMLTVRWQSGDHQMTEIWQSGAGMSGNDVCTCAIRNGKWPSLFPFFGIGNWNERSKSQLLRLGIREKPELLIQNCFFLDYRKKVWNGKSQSPLPAGRRPNRFNYTARQKKNISDSLYNAVWLPTINPYLR